MAIEGSWSGMRKYLEKEMTAEHLRGRIRYGCTRYVEMDGCHIFELCIDGKQIKRFSHETLYTYFIENKSSEASSESVRLNFHKLWDNTPMQNRTEYTDNEFCDALEEYRKQDIKKSICSENPIVKMFALFDRRVGKRTLKKIKNDMDGQPKWIYNIYKLRCESENIA